MTKNCIRLLKYMMCTLMLSACFFPVSARSESIEVLLARLDSMIANENYYVLLKQRKIADIKNSRRKATTQEEIYWNNKQLYDEYFVFDADSAMRYAIDNLSIAQAVGNKQWECEWRINKSFSLSVMGLLNDAQEELSQIVPSSLSSANKIKYYGQLAYLYSHIGQLSGHRIIGNEDYDHISHMYEDSISALITPDNPSYWWYAASSKVDSEEFPEDLIGKLKAMVDNGANNSRADAMNSYILSRLYNRIGDKENRMRYLILSGMTDVSTANRDIASINELADILLEEGDIDRAYTYVNYIQNQALRLPNRVRAASLAETVSQVHHLHEEKLRESQRNLRIVLMVVFTIAIMLGLLIMLYYRRSRQLKRSQSKLEDTNHALTQHMHELSKSKNEREELIANLQTANTRNEEISATLREANYVKEECIGATFALCSANIYRFEKYRNDILKLVRAQKWKELQEEVQKASRLNRELKEFYHSFDTLFLNIYPDFVNDFNQLLRPEEQLTIPSGTLNTELRIYALVRLGISDSVKIAKLLHCSPQTVYNYRLRMRNKSTIEKGGFADAVKSLGKFTP